MRFIDITGKQYGKLTVIKRISDKGVKHIKWLCKCDCGNESEVCGDSLKYGNTKSCGCLKKEKIGMVNYSHGHCSGGLTVEYNAWSRMKYRCLNEKCERFSSYGGRGIEVCDNWISSFSKFYEDMGVCPKGYSLERKNVNGNYEPDNCIWIPLADQRTNKRDSIMVDVDGESLPLVKACKIFGVNYKYIHHCTKYKGLSFPEAVKKNKANMAKVSLRKRCNDIGVNHKSVYYHMKYKGLSFNESVSMVKSV